MRVKVLVVDDNPYHYQLVSDFLEDTAFADYILEWAADYKSAFESIVTKNYDVCLLDYDLGAHSGLDLILEPEVQKRGIPTIFLTGRGNDEIDIQAMHAGVVDYLDKGSLKPDNLERAIRYAAQRSQTLKAEHEQRVFSEALLSIITALNSTLEFTEVVERILHNIGKVIPHDTVDFMLVESGYTRTVKCLAYDDPELEVLTMQARFAVAETQTFFEMKDTKLPILITDIETYNEWVSAWTTGKMFKSYLGAPVFHGSQLLGYINLTSFQPNFFTQEHSERLRVFAQQASVAIQNAQQYEQAQEAAAAEERNRLARELHDSVTQTLFSASVIAETLSRLVENDLDETREGLVKLSRLTRGALAEMRTLLVELRPTALTGTPLSTLFTQLINGLNSRLDARLNLAITGTPFILKPDTQVALYRIGQEAINNTIKHAEAHEVNVTLNFKSDNVLLQVHDDGIGFDVDAIPANHLGIRFMRERARKNNIHISIDSEINEGTHIQAHWQNPA